MNNPNNEPTLESIGDYDTLKGSKKKIVWGVVIAGILISVVYLVISSNYSHVDDHIKIKDPITKVENITVK